MQALIELICLSVIMFLAFTVAMTMYNENANIDKPKKLKLLDKKDKNK